MSRCGSFVFVFFTFTLISSFFSFSEPGFARSENATQLPLCEGRNLVESMKRDNVAQYESLTNLAAQDINSDALLWRVKREGLPPSYLFGTYHSTDPRIANYPSEVAMALKETSTVLLEIDNLDSSIVQHLAQKRPELFFQLDDGRLSQELSPEDFKALLAQAQKLGFPAQMIASLRPWYANLTLFSIPSCEAMRLAQKISVLDEKIKLDAKAMGKKIVGLETVEEQFSAFASIPHAHQVTLLKEGLYGFDQLTDLYVTARYLYLSRQLGHIMPLSLITAKDKVKMKAALEAFKEHLIVNRNLRMRDRALGYFNEGKAFMAVGALHLNGKQGLVALLRKEGFTVEKIK